MDGTGIAGCTWKIRPTAATRTVAASEWSSLRGVWADLIAFCSIVRSRSAVLRFLSESFARPVSDDEVGDLVGELLRQNYLIQEGRKYLSVIVVSEVAEAPRVPFELIQVMAETRPN